MRNKSYDLLVRGNTKVTATRKGVRFLKYRGRVRWYPNIWCLMRAVWEYDREQKDSA